MNGWQHLSNWSASVLSVATLVGLVARARVRRSYTFAVYLIVVAGQGLRLALTHEPVSWRAWLYVELVLRLLCAAVAIEIALRLFVALPVAASRARHAIVAVLAFTALLLLLDLPEPSHPPFVQASEATTAAFAAAQRLLPRLAYGSAWLFAALYALATAFALPVDPLHRRIIMGLGSYLLLYAVTLATLSAGDWHARTVSAVQTVLFLALLALWTHAAWRREPTPDVPPDIIRRVWPWS